MIWVMVDITTPGRRGNGDRGVILFLGIPLIIFISIKLSKYLTNFTSERQKRIYLERIYYKQNNNNL